MTIERNKGNSLLLFPDSFVCVDTETTGLDPKWDSIIEFGAVRYENGKAIDRFSCLVRPDRIYAADDEDADYVMIDGRKCMYIDSFITELTGITNQMLETAPLMSEVLPSFLQFVGDSVIVGHNVNFDINFIYDTCMNLLNQPFTNDYIDTMRISRRLVPEYRHHRLKDLAERFNVDYSHAHRAVDDVDITIQCYEQLKEMAIEKYGKPELPFVKNGGYRYHYLDLNSIVPDASLSNPDSPLYEKSVCITGELEHFGSRKDALQAIANIGGIPANSVTKQTNYLVLGNNDYNHSIKDGKSSKQKKAEKLILEGQDLQIISENVLLDMLGMETE